MSARWPLGAIVGARSGDKGGHANVGVWVPDPIERLAVRRASDRQAPLTVHQSDIALADARFAWLHGFLTAERLGELLPEATGLRIDRIDLPNLRAVNFIVHGLLGRGVADSTRSDPQAKGLAEHLRARLVPIPVELRPGIDTTRTP